MKTTIAEAKKQKNISEYIIHIYQSEDLLRVYQFQLDEINQYVFGNTPLNDEEKKIELDWYQALADVMKKEEVLKEGHTSWAQNHITELQNLHVKLLSEDEAYQKIYQEAKSDIDHYLGLSNGLITEEVQICINGIYGMLLLKLQGKKVHASLQPALEHFGDILTYLSHKYQG